MLNAYPDSIGRCLSDAVDMLKRPEFEDAFSLFYILPTFFEGDLDRGLEGRLQRRHLLDVESDLRAHQDAVARVLDVGHDPFQLRGQRIIRIILDDLALGPEPSLHI